MMLNLLIYDLGLRASGFVGLLAFALAGGVVLGALTAGPPARALVRDPPG